MMFFKLAMPGMWNKVTFYTSAQAYILSCLHQTLYSWEWMLNLKEKPFPFWECMLSCIWTPILTQLSIPLSTIFCVHCLFCVFVIKWLPLLWCIWTNKVLLSQATPNKCGNGFFPCAMNNFRVILVFGIQTKRIVQKLAFNCSTLVFYCKNKWFKIQYWIWVPGT